MEVSEIQEFVRENLHDPEGEKVGLSLIATKLGQYAETRVRLAAAPEGAVPQKAVEQVLGDILASTLFVIAHAAEDEGVDLEAAAIQRLEQMEEVYEQQRKFDDAVKEGDLETIKEMVEQGLEEEGIDFGGGDDTDEPSDLGREVY